MTDTPKRKSPKLTTEQNQYPDLFSDRQLQEIIEDVHAEFNAPTSTPRQKLPPHH
jgi:hypothetical protein